jgi:hypothetical protein
MERQPRGSPLGSVGPSFAETESPAARLLGGQDMTRQDAVNFIIHGIAKGGGETAG